MGGFILSNQRFYLPNWVPLVGTDFFDVKAEFSTAQAVTPGQGQTVDISGVPVGEIKKVDLVNGRAVVTMAIKRKYAHLIKSDATALLRPKTGLKDMIIEMDPGTPGPRRSRTATRSPSRRRGRTSTWTRSCPSSTATPAPTCGCWWRAAPRP